MRRAWLPPFALSLFAKEFILLALVLLAVVCFLLGSIPWGLIISKSVFHTDIREHGSGNIGTTNAMRTMGKKGGAAVFVLVAGVAGNEVLHI